MPHSNQQEASPEQQATKWSSWAGRMMACMEERVQNSGGEPSRRMLNPQKIRHPEKHSHIRSKNRSKRTTFGSLFAPKKILRPCFRGVRFSIFAAGRSFGGLGCTAAKAMRGEGENEGEWRERSLRRKSHSVQMAQQCVLLFVDTCLLCQGSKTLL